MDNDEYYLRDSVGRFDGEEHTFSVEFGEDSTLRGLTLLDGEILVADVGLDVIHRLTPQGVPVGTFASTLNPSYLEVDSRGNVYSTSGAFSTARREPPNQIVTRFDSSGAVTGTFGHPDLVAPSGVDADAFGNIYVADGNDRKLYKFSPDGVMLGSIDLPAYVFDIAIDEEGARLFTAGDAIGDDEIGTLIVYELTDDLPVFDRTLDNPPTRPDYGPFGLFTGLYYDEPTGHLFTTDGIDSNAYEYNEDLELIGSLFTGVRNGDVQIDIIALPVPEPTSAALAAAAMCWIASRRRGHRSARASECLH